MILHVHHILCTFQCFHCTNITWKCLISRFMDGGNKQHDFFLFWTWICTVFRRNSTPGEILKVSKGAAMKFIKIWTEETATKSKIKGHNGLLVKHKKTASKFKKRCIQKKAWRRLKRIAGFWKLVSLTVFQIKVHFCCF